MQLQPFEAQEWETSIKKNDWELLFHWKKSILLFGFMSNFSVNFFIRSEIFKEFYKYPWSQNWTMWRGFKNSIQIRTEIGNYYSHSAIKTFLLTYLHRTLLQLLIKTCLNIEYNPCRCSDIVWFKRMDTHLLLYTVANVYPFFWIRR